MKNFIIGFIVGATLFTAVFAYAAGTRIILINGAEQDFGTSANPIYIQGV